MVYSNDHAPLTVRPIYSSSKLRTAQMMIFSLVAMIRLEKCCITSAYLQWLCHSGEQDVAYGPLVYSEFTYIYTHYEKKKKKADRDKFFGFFFFARWCHSCNCLFTCLNFYARRIS